MSTSVENKTGTATKLQSTDTKKTDKKLSIICFSGDFDKAVAAFTLASGAAAVNYKVRLFFTFWGLNLLKNNTGRRFTGKGLLARFFNWLQGGRNNLPMSRLNFAGVSSKLMTGLMKRRNVATLEELFEATKALGVELYACEMSMNILGMTEDDFIAEVKEVIGVPKFLEFSRDGETLFI
jgi:peroxiredoxin family protein